MSSHATLIGRSVACNIGVVAQRSSTLSCEEGRCVTAQITAAYENIQLVKSIILSFGKFLNVLLINYEEQKKMLSIKLNDFGHYFPVALFLKLKIMTESQNHSKRSGSSTMCVVIPGYRSFCSIEESLAAVNKVFFPSIKQIRG